MKATKNGTAIAQGLGNTHCRIKTGPTGSSDMNTRKLLRAILRLPEFKNSFLGAKQGFALMNECHKYNLFNELVLVENMVGIEKGYLKQESLKLELRRTMQFL